jgi:hypothetical protein
MENDWEEQKQAYIHEAMDRISIINSNIDDFIIKHPAAENIPTVMEKVKKAQESLSAAYQELGQHCE